MISLMSIKVEFIGHACFRIWANGHPLVLTDPYPPIRLGLPPLDPLEAETVIVSSLTDEAHSNIQLVQYPPR